MSTPSGHKRARAEPDQPSRPRPAAEAATTIQPCSRPPDSPLPTLFNKRSHPEMLPEERTQRNNQLRKAHPGVRLRFVNGHPDSDMIWAKTEEQRQREGRCRLLLCVRG